MVQENPSDAYPIGDLQFRPAQVTIAKCKRQIDGRVYESTPIFVNGCSGFGNAAYSAIIRPKSKRALETHGICNSRCQSDFGAGQSAAKSDRRDSRWLDRSRRAGRETTS